MSIARKAGIITLTVVVILPLMMILFAVLGAGLVFSYIIHPTINS